MTDTRDLHDPAPDPASAAPLDPRLLRYFVGVAEELHFGRAARRLHIAQQPLSQAVQRLEAQLGVRLLERTSRRVALTEPGHVFLGEARAVLRRSAEAVEAARRAARGETGALAVGYGSGTLDVVMPGAVRRFRERHPGVALRLAELDAPAIEAALGAGDLDVGLLVPPVGDAALATEVVHREPLVLALPAGHPLAARPAVALAAAAAEPFVLYERAVKPAMRDAAVALCRGAGFGPRVVQEAGTQAAVVGLVAAGLGVALVCWSARETAPRGVAFRPLEGGTLAVDLVAAWRRAEASRFVAAWVAAAREAAAESARARPVRAA